MTELNSELEILYMKRAAELGLPDAQHNLGCMYLERKVLKYNSLKAAAWFSQAAAGGYISS